jgi:hypothetical protein
MRRALAVLSLACGCGGHAAGGGGPGPADARVIDAPVGAIDSGLVTTDAPLAMDAPAGASDAPLDGASDARLDGASSAADAAVVDAPLGGGADAAPGDGGSADGAMADARLADAPVPDARRFDARPADARPPDARSDAAMADARIDAAPPMPDAGCGPLELATDDAYIVHESSTVVSDAVAGTGPFTCSFYNGAGAGTRPDGLTLTGATCTLSGGGGGQPGQYGFIVVVRDACNQTLEVPVAFDNGDCPDNAALDPPAWPPRVPSDPTGGYGWLLEAAIGVRNFDDTCQACFGMSVSTRSPTTLAAGLECDNPGDLCSDCDGCIEPIHAGCTPPQTSLAMSREVEVRAHDPLRSGAGWLTMGIHMVFSSTTDETC